jgi:hypothetical protein
MPEQGNPISSPQDTPLNTGGTTPQESAGSLQHIRALAMPFSKGPMITEPDGSLLIKDVPMLAAGVWTDSAVQTPLYYTAKTLEADAANWLDNSGWNRHSGKVPRASTDKVGEAVNPHFGRFMGTDGLQHEGVISDVRVWPFTQNQRDMQEMIRHGLIKYVSVEHGGEERYNTATRQMESASLIFTGFAFVNKGACKLCRLNEEAAPPTAPTEEKSEEPMADTKELEAMIAAQGAQMKELSEAIKAQKPATVTVEVPKDISEAVGKIKELAALPATIKTLTDRIDALEKDGTAKTGAGNTKELEAMPEFYVPVDRKKGTVGGQ